MLIIDTEPLNDALKAKAEEMDRPEATIALVAGVHPRTADRILEGNVKTRLEKIVDFAEFFGLDVKVEYVPQA